ncbi:MAG: hypothetical protein L0207_01930 [Chlamydiae bacterium]|nr:hypothetical protein [Chlamydiota bacterium]
MPSKVMMGSLDKVVQEASYCRSFAGASLFRRFSAEGEFLRTYPKTRPFRDLKGFLMRVRINRRRSYAKLHMIKEVEVKDRKNLSKIEGMVLGQVLRNGFKRSSRRFG